MASDEKSTKIVVDVDGDVSAAKEATDYILELLRALGYSVEVESSTFPYKDKGKT